MSISRQTEIAELAQERVTLATRIINTDHSYIHEGIAFKAHLYVDVLAGAASESYSFYAPTGKYIHFKNMKLAGIGASVKIEMFRGTTANPLTINSAGTTAAELTGPNNASDVSAIVSGVVIKKTPTYTDSETGEVWDAAMIVGSSTNQTVSSGDVQMSENFELIMKPDTYYVLKVTNLTVSDAAADVNIDMFWYEEGSA